MSAEYGDKPKAGLEVGSPEWIDALNRQIERDLFHGQSLSSVVNGEATLSPVSRRPLEGAELIGHFVYTRDQNGKIHQRFEPVSETEPQPRE